MLIRRDWRDNYPKMTLEIPTEFLDGPRKSTNITNSLGRIFTGVGGGGEGYFNLSIREIRKYYEK